MATVYISDTLFGKYVAEHGDNAKEAIREVVKENKPE